MADHKENTITMAALLVGLFGGYAFPLGFVQFFAAWAGLGVTVRGGLWARESWRTRKLDRKASPLAITHKEQP